MAYNASREQNTETALINMNNFRGEYLRIAQVVPTGSKSAITSIDFRIMYPTDGDELGFSQKGFRIKSEMFKDFMKGIILAIGEDEKQDILELLEMSEKGQLKHEAKGATEKEAARELD